jgi:hypothetical protein
MGIHSLNHRLWTSVVESSSQLSITAEDGKHQEESEAGSASVIAR